MGIGALASAFATFSAPAVGAANAPREQPDSASAPEGSQPAVPRVVFNPRSHFDASAGVFVMEFRDAETGELERQFPDENQLRAYANAKKLEVGGGSGDAAAEPQQAATGGAAAPDTSPAQPQAAAAPAPIRLEV